MKLGYARVSTRDQNLDLQVDALKRAGCEHIYQDIAGGSKPRARRLMRCWVNCGPAMCS
jgi:DNA invertase Pin-like site-specific DNA recombinase